MSDTAQPPPISRLNDDVLLTIFEFNANIFTTKKDYYSQYDVLDTTRFTSQVCSSWRAVMLSKTTIWAHLIDFNHFHFFQSTEWGKEIIRRAGDTTPLWIKATSSWTIDRPPADAQLRFFQRIIDRHWDRIQKLLLSGSWLAHLDLRNSPLYRPASVLNMFHVQISDSPTGWVIISKNQSQMFPGSPIPIYALNKNLELRTPWLHALHSLTLAPVYRIRECLAVLSATPNLQYLKVSSLLRQMRHFSRSVVALPKLKDLTLILNFDRMTFVLDHLQFPPECAVHLTAYEGGSVVVTPAQMISTLSRVSQTYFKSRPPQTIDMVFGESGTVSVCDSERSDDCVFRLLCPLFNNIPDYTRKISTALSLPEFSSVTELKLHYDFAQIAIPDFSFLKFFSSVEILHINEELLYYITMQNPGNGPIVFPTLKVVKLRSAVDTPFSLGDDIVKFVLLRIEKGCPISVLDIMAFKELETYCPTIKSLQSISGLKVISRAV